MASKIEALQAGGFSDEDIAAWTTERRTTLAAAGFQDNEIDAYFSGGVTVPKEIPPALANRVRVGEAWGRIFSETAKGLSEGYGTPTPTGLDDKTLDDLIKIGVFHDPLNSKPGPLQVASETAILPLAKTFTTLMHGINAGLHGAGGFLGQLHDEIGLNLPGTRGTGESLRKEVVNFGNMLLIESGMGRFSRPRVGPSGAVDEAIGGAPTSADFVNSSKVIGDGTAPLPVQEKLLKLYQEQGRHPSEVAADAASEPVVAQRLLSKDPLDMPYNSETTVTIDGKTTTIRDGKVVEEPAAGGGGKGGEPPKPPAEPSEPPPPGSFEEAQSKVLSKVSVGDREPGRPWTFDRLYTEAIDDLHPLKAVGEDAYQMARLTRGQFGKAEYFLERGTFNFDTYANTGKPLREILDPVRKDLDGLRAYLTSQRAVELEASGRASGIDLEAANRVIAEGGGKYGKIAGELVDYQNRLLTYLKDSGVVSEGAFDAMVEANKNYVPFYRLMVPEKAPPGSGSRLGPGNPIHKLKGSEREIVDPLESIIKNTYAYVSIAERNAAGTAIIDALKAQGFKVETAKRGPKPDADLVAYLKEQGITEPEKLAEFVRAAAPLEGETISAYRAGVRETVKVDDPELVAAFRGLDRGGVGMLTRIFAVPAKALRAGATLTPDFMARNLIRDFMTAFVNTKGLVFHPVDTLSGLYSVLRKDASWENWVKAGGANSTMVALDRAYLQESLTKLAGETGLMERAWNVVRHPIAEGLKPLRMVSEMVENATRVAEFKKQIGLTATKAEMQEAAFGAREVTLDFARMGARMRAYNMITAFANAQIQGVDRIVRAFGDRPVNTSLKVAGGITLPSVLLWWANHDDPRYQELPHWQKHLFWIIPTDKWEKVDAVDAQAKPEHLVRQRAGGWEVNNGSIWRIPKPFELGVIFGTGPEVLLDATIGKDKHAFEGFTKSVMQVLTPSYIPTAVQPVIEQFANRSTFIDRTLIPAGMEKHLPEYQYTPYTTQLSRALGQVISAFPGVREAATDPGNVAGGAARAVTSPILIENYIRGWTGGLGVYALGAADAALRKAGVLPDPIKPTDTLADIPFVKAFAVRYPSASAQPIQDFHDDFEKNKRFFDTWMARAKDGDVEAMNRIEAAGGPAMFAQLGAVKDTLADHSKLVRDIYKHPTTPAAEKRQLIDSLYWSMIQIGRHGREMQRAIKEAQPAP